MNYFLVLYNHAYHTTSSTLYVVCFACIALSHFVTPNFTLSGTICWSVKLNSSGTSWDSFLEKKQTKAWSSIYCSHNAAEQQCSKTCFCSCLQQMHIDFLFHKLFTSPIIKNSPMACSRSFFETSSKFPVFCKVYALVFSGKSSDICFHQLLEVLQQWTNLKSRDTYKRSVNEHNQALRMLYQSLINSRAQYGIIFLGKSSFMSFVTNIGCFKSRHEMFKHKWTCD